MDCQAPACREAFGLAGQLRLPLAAVLGRPLTEEGRERVWHAEQGDCRLDLARGAAIANESLVPGETSMGTLRTRKRRSSDTGRGITRLHLDLHARVSKQLHTRPPMNSSTPVPACGAAHPQRQPDGARRSPGAAWPFHYPAIGTTHARFGGPPTAHPGCLHHAQASLRF